MAFLRLLLLALLVSRLMVPPGICLCKLAGETHHEGHDDGCPSSPLASAMGLKPASHVIDLPSVAFAPPADFTASATSPEAVTTPLLSYPSAPPSYLSACALLI